MNVFATLRYHDADGPHAFTLTLPSTSIGRSADQDFVLADKKVSRQHAVVLREGDTFTIVDQNSTRGTFVNGQRVERAALLHGDVLQLGSATANKLRFHQLSEGDAAESTSLYQLLSTRHTPITEPGRQPASQAIATSQMEQLNWLLLAARQLNQGSAIEDILRVLLRLTLQLTGVERGFVFLSEDKVLRYVLGLSAEDELLPEDSTLSRRAIEQAVASESKFSISDTLADVRASEWSSIFANSIRSIYCIPLRTRAAADGSHQLLGLLYLDSKRSSGALTAIDHQLLDAISTESAALVHNALLAAAEQRARQAREELAVAARIHSGLMSKALPTIPYARLSAKTVPCLAIGGDFYDAVALPDCVSVTIVDVSGKGVAAAIVAATIQGIIHAQLLARQPLTAIASMLNEFLCARDVGKYCTLVLVSIFPDGRFEYLNCGHIAPIAVLGGHCRTLTETNLIVGLIPQAEYVSTWDQLAPGERLLLATDGVTEAENAAGEPFGDTHFNAVLCDGELAEILRAVAAFHAPEPAQDDCTLLEIRYTG